MQRPIGRTTLCDFGELQGGRCRWSTVDKWRVGGGDIARSCRICWTTVRLQHFIRAKGEHGRVLSRGRTEHDFNVILLAIGWKMHCRGTEAG